MVFPLLPALRPVLSGQLTLKLQREMEKRWRQIWVFMETDLGPVSPPARECSFSLLSTAFIFLNYFTEYVCMPCHFSEAKW